jgi:maleylacetate reductase
VRSFIHEASAQRIVFGVGTIATVSTELDRMNVTRAVVLSTAGHRQLARQVADLLGECAVGQFHGAVPHTPVEVTEEALEYLRNRRPDAVVSVGGGSTTGLGKAVASRLGIQHLVIPTTYAGSELTPVLGETSGGEKTTRSGPELMPNTVLYDIELTATLPWSVTLSSAINAMAHAVEALYSPDASDRTDEMALQAVRSIDQGLRSLHDDRESLDARCELLYGAYLAGKCLGAVPMGLHHKVCHVLGGTFTLPHAPTHAVVLPYVMAYNEPVAPAAMSRIAEALDSDHAPSAAQSLVQDLGGPTALRDIGFARADIGRAAELVVSRPHSNPREVTLDGITQLLQQAFDGNPVLPM